MTYRVIGMDSGREVRLCLSTGRVFFGPMGEVTSAGGEKPEKPRRARKKTSAATG